MSTIQIRIDEKTKKEAKKVFESFGLNMSEAIKLYLKSVIETKTGPFVLSKNKKLKKRSGGETYKRSRRGSKIWKKIFVRERLSKIC